MTHEGRMKRGEKNYAIGLLDNEDTRYFLEHKEEPKPEVKEEKPKKRGKK